ncbi:hypothetical protein K3172_03680 [Qipengyuania sp. 6B39]|uniref:hypothetical protein n=1 Tax=Qipengyuania proteolytica TaxID=2867239 RepID=UPI001C89DD05|nr:hypothetical protein [Qipengyuania proteolytica]MBX7494955.1 hypothetical protein [Qipengyuania proteolytica]
METPTPPPTPPVVVTDIDFATQAALWSSDYADYSPGMESGIAFESGLRDLPAPLTGKGLLLGGRNASDDLLMYAFSAYQGFAPDTDYKVKATVTIATNAPDSCFGAGGPPSALWLRAGAAPRAPAKAYDPALQLVRVNVDKGEQAGDGTEAVVLGDIGTPDAGDCLSPTYAIKVLPERSDAPVIRSTADGRLWLFLGTESGFEARSEYYLLSARFTFEPQP